MNNTNLNKMNSMVTEIFGNNLRGFMPIEKKYQNIKNKDRDYLFTSKNCRPCERNKTATFTGKLSYSNALRIIENEKLLPFILSQIINDALNHLTNEVGDISNRDILMSILTESGNSVNYDLKISVL